MIIIKLLLALSLAVTASIAPASAASDPVLVAAGDIAGAPGCTPTATACQQATTARLVAAQGPSTVAALGDTQYPDGTLSQFQNSYAPTWGQFKGKTKFAVGNHEYHTRNAQGYRDYTGNMGGTDLSYAFTPAPGWRALVLNSNCKELATYTDRDCAWLASWIKRDIAAHPTKCIMGIWHHPYRTTSAESGPSSLVRPFLDALYSKRADVVLNGHGHVYEEWEKLTPGGTRSSTGIKQFTVGTGGKSLYGFSRWDDRIVASNRASEFGVLKMTLKPSSYSYSFKTIKGATKFSGSRTCN